MDTEYTSTEIMVVTAAKEIRDREIVLVGQGWPAVIGVFAQRVYVPNITIVYGTGVIDPEQKFLSQTEASALHSVADPSFAAGAALVGDPLDVLGAELHAGKVDLGILGAAQVDKYGNINTTCIGNFKKPRLRFFGAGGAPDVANLAGRTVIVLEHDRKKFPEKVDFVTSPGYLGGGDARKKLGLRGGPSAVVTTLGVFRFDKKTKEMYLDAVYPGVSAEEIKTNVGWELKIAKELKESEPPTKEELKMLRS